jgi:hypothetical protein
VGDKLDCDELQVVETLFHEPNLRLPGRKADSE